MKIKPVCLVGKHQYSFRPGESAVVLGVNMITPTLKGARERLCYCVYYSDGTIDYVPFSEIARGTYKLEACGK